MNRFVWNYRGEGPTSIPGIVIMEAQGGGPPVPPGAYQVKLTVAGKNYTAPLTIKADPRVKASQADLEKQYEFVVKVRDRVTELHNTVNQMRASRAALEKARGQNPAVNGVLSKMAAIEEEMTQVKSTSRDAALVYPIMLDAQYADLGNVAETADSAPPQQVYDVFQEYEQRRANLMERWKALQQEIGQLGVAGAAASGDQ